MAASPLIATATSRALGAGALDRPADRLAHRLGIHDGLLVDRILGRGLGRIGLDPVLPPRHGKLDQLDRRSGYVKSQEGPVLALKEEHFYFLFRYLRLKTTAPYEYSDALYISAKLN